MRIGGRVGFNRIEELERNFGSIDFPIELALPWKYRDLWLPMEDRLDEVLVFLRERALTILSVHATQGKITEEEFLRWGRLTLEFAKSLGVEDVTVHPNIVGRERPWCQRRALSYMRQLKGQSIFSIETFSGRKRVFTPSELVDQGLPMTLDTAHIHRQQDVMDIVEQNHPNIRVVHLSAIGAEEHHLPIDEFCIRVVDRLMELNWSGNIILEYLPWHHYRIRDDVRALSDHVAHGKPLKLLPVNDQFRDQPERYGYNPDGTN
jgi:sugar phosphate isomerase/epimerase